MLYYFKELILGNIFYFDEKKKELQKLVDTLSSPIIPVLDGIVVVPLIGQFDEMRPEKLIVKTLSRIEEKLTIYL
ncbi:hypothetical protein ACQKE5_12845 [Paenisporosarcina sp. NPDC076898]|uniref:hypothetical protein n=1 Tax=Paenisporosarcina sp. NPDC076898 TaxID=3390603 RepID=UPI003D06760C